MAGQIGKMCLKKQKQQLYNDVDVIVNISEKFIFAYGNKDEKYFFILGFRHIK